MTADVRSMAREAGRRARARIEAGHPGHPDDVLRECCLDVVDERMGALPDWERSNLADRVETAAGPMPHPDDGRSEPGDPGDWSMFGGGRF